MKEMTFRTIGVLPAAAGRWFIREGGGHIWFVSEDAAVAPMVLSDGELRQVVDYATDATAPLIMPKVDA